MLYRKLAVFIIFFIIVLFFWQSCAKKTPPQINLPEGKTAHIVFIVGDVFLKPMGESTWVKAEVGDTVTEGTKIRTAENSYCELVISSGTIFRMKDRSELQLAMLPEDKAHKGSLIKLVRGDLFTKAQKIAYRSKDAVETDTVNLTVRGTEFLVHAESGGVTGKTEVLVGKGTVRVRMHVEAPPAEELPVDLKPIMRKIERGVAVREGFKLEVTSQKVNELERTINEIARRGRAEDAEIEGLKQKIQLAPVPLDKEGRKRIEELGEINLDFETGETFYLSPNFDGRNDDFAFSTEAFKDEKLYGWKLVITDGDSTIQQVVKSRIAEEGEEITLPDTILWNLVNLNGNVVHDGNYVYMFYTINRNSSDTLRVKGVIVVDTTPPELFIEAQDKTFSPNGDGVKDNILFTLQAEKDIEWSCTIATPEEIIVKTIEWGTDIPAVFEWDGKGENGTVLPEGVYDITVSGRDRAGNITEKTAQGITIDVRERQATVDIDTHVFSPNGDGMLDSLTFIPILSDRSRIDTWDLIVQTEKGDTAKRFRGRRYIPLQIVWDGKPQGKLSAKYPSGLPSGRYAYFLKVIYRSGVNTYSFKKQLILDNDPPEIELGLTPQLFSPDGDGKDDILVINPEITDLTSIKTWTATIYSAGGSAFKEFTGQGMPAEEIFWDGISDTGILVDSGEDYYLVFEATDEGFNTGTSGEISFSIDILVVQTERGLKIRVSNIEFGFNTADLTGEKSFDILDKIVKILDKYKKYSVVIEGHTDSTGDENYNLTLSKKRSESVGKYLIGKGINAERLSYEGHGSQFPVDTNETKEGRRRNRRVEFLLVRK